MCQYEWLAFCTINGHLENANNLLLHKLTTAKIFWDFYAPDLHQVLRNFQQREEKIEKVIIIINKAPTHPSLDQLSNIN